MRTAAGLRRCFRHGSAGFTLVELMVVLALIGIMVALIIPEMRGTFEHEVLRATSRQALQAMNIAYSQAITTQRRHRVRLDRQVGQLIVEELNPENLEGAGVRVLSDLPGAASKVDPRVTIEVQPRTDSPSSPPEGQKIDAVSPAAEVEEPDNEGGILFYPDGTAEAKEMVLHDREGFTLALRVNAITSRIQVVELGRH